MVKPIIALVLSRQSWSIFAVQQGVVEHLGTAPWDANNPDAAASEIKSLVSSGDLIHANLTLLLDSDLVVSANFRIDTPQMFRKRSAMLFELEKWLPAAAEDMAATFTRRDLDVFAVATLPSEFEGLTAALENVGLQTASVFALMSLAIAHAVREQKVKSLEALLWLRKNKSADLVYLERGHVLRWTSLLNAPEQILVEHRIAQLDLGEVPTLNVIGPGNYAIESLSRFLNITLAETTSDDPLVEMALTELSMIHQGRVEPSGRIDGVCVSDGAFQSPLNKEWFILQLALTVLFISISISNWLSIKAAKEASQRHQAAANETFRNLYPDSRLRSSPRVRLESEYAKLAGVRGEKSDLELAGSALPMLHDLLEAMPTDMRFRITEARIKKGELQLAGEVRSYSDSDRIAASLRSKGLLVTAPSTQRLPNEGVSFRLSAETEVINPKEKRGDNGTAQQ